jgi:hypothetical protein
VCGLWRVVALLALLTSIASAANATAGELASRIDDALALCAAADDLAPVERLPVLARGLELADAAVALDERSARAHFAVVCNLGKATALAAPGFGTFGAVRRLRREIDVTIALAPNDADALAAKGAFLLKIPRWLGGDRQEAELWLRRALAVDPLNATARAHLEELAPMPARLAPAAASEPAAAVDATVTR